MNLYQGLDFPGLAVSVLGLQIPKYPKSPRGPKSYREYFKAKVYTTADGQNPALP